MPEIKERERGRVTKRHSEWERKEIKEGRKYVERRLVNQAIALEFSWELELRNSHSLYVFLLHVVSLDFLLAAKNKEK